MSKGWESKNVEEQQAQAALPVRQRSDTYVDPAVRAAEADRQRRVQALEMTRERVLSERTSSPHRRSALETALKSIEYELEQLGWSIKL
jgi:hypothetical protein